VTDSAKTPTDAESTSMRKATKGLRTMLPETRTNKHRAFGGIRLKAPEE